MGVFELKSDSEKDKEDLKEDELPEGPGQCEAPAYTDARFEFFPTPPKTPPAALLAAYI